MVVVSTVTGNTSGSIKIFEHQDSKLFDESVRMSRTATLDGSCLITHGGFSDGDRTMTVRATGMTEVEAESLRVLFKSETMMLLATEEGVFEGAMERLKIDHGDVVFTFKCKENLCT